MKIEHLIPNIRDLTEEELHNVIMTGRLAREEASAPKTRKVKGEGTKSTRARKEEFTMRFDDDDDDDLDLSF